MNISLEDLAVLLNKKPGDIPAALKEGTEADIKSWVEGALSERIEASVSNAKSAARNEGYGRGKREALTEIERQLKDKYKVDGANVEEIMVAYGQSMQESSKANPEDVKTSPAYTEMESKYKDRIAALEKELNDERQSNSARELMRTAVPEIVSLLKDEGYPVPEDPKKQEAYIKLLFPSIQGENAKLTKNAAGELVVVGSDGKTVRDDVSMKDLTVKDHVLKSLSGVLEKPATQKQGTGGQLPDGTGGSATGKQFDFSSIKSENDYLEALINLDSDKDAAQIDALHKHHAALASD